MLANAKLQRDFESIGNVVQEVLKNTDGRYKQDLEQMLDAIRNISRNLSIESEYLAKIESFKARGFKVKKLIEQPYDDFVRAKLAIGGAIKMLEELSKIANEYEGLRHKVNPELRTKFEAIMKDPEQIAHIKSLWGKIKSM